MIYVFEIPLPIPTVGFRFAGAAPVEFGCVDWFNEPQEVPALPNISREELEQFLSGKVYRQPGRRYLVLADHRPDLTFVLEPAAS